MTSQQIRRYELSAQHVLDKGVPASRSDYIVEFRNEEGVLAGVASSNSLEGLAKKLSRVAVLETSGADTITTIACPVITHGFLERPLTPEELGMFYHEFIKCSQDILFITRFL